MTGDSTGSTRRVIACGITALVAGTLFGQQAWADPAIALTKTVGTDSSICASASSLELPPGGGNVTYCYKVENTGDVALGLHDLVDDQLGAILSGFAFTLSPQASAFITQTAVITTTTTNNAIWTAYNSEPGDGDSDQASATVTVPAAAPAIALTKTVGTDSSVCASASSLELPPGGGNVTYCYTVENTGNIALGLHDLVDDQLGSILSGFAFTLNPQASAFLTQTAVITTTTTNNATWTAYNSEPGDGDSDQASATVTVPAAAPAIALTKTVGTDPSVCASASSLDLPPGGGNVTYCYTVENTGNIALGLHDLIDDQLGSILSGFAFTLNPQASVFLTQTALITTTTTNNATWTAYNSEPGDGDSDQASATVTVPAAAPAIALTKTVGTDPSVCASASSLDLPPGGGNVTYCYTVENTGSVALAVHDLVDDQLGSILNGFAYVLAPQASVFLTQTALITTNTTNTATWTAYNTEPGDGADAQASATVRIGMAPAAVPIPLLGTLGLILLATFLVLLGASTLRRLR
jgi:archaellum component FlaG (FlaF/FlaG flagellin family)